MGHIVTDKCVDCRFTDCVETCPVACFHSDNDRLYINQDLCVDCGACIPACPVHAIYDIVDMPDEYEPWIAINKERSEALPSITAKEEPKSTAEARKVELGY